MNSNTELLTKSKKPKLFNVLVKQFPRAFKAITKRSELGHVKYERIDQDWQGFTHTSIEDYENALVRHMMQDGEPDETELDHLTALAWNAMALLELKLRANE